MLVAGYLAEYGDDADALTLVAQIAGQAPQISGLGPSTQRAIEHFRTAGELPQEDGATNGAAMRALPVGWAIPLDAAERRRGLAIELSRATHLSAEAQCAACVIAACGSWAIEGASSRLIVEVAAGEAVGKRLALMRASTDGSHADRSATIAAGHSRPQAACGNAFATNYAG